MTITACPTCGAKNRVTTSIPMGTIPICARCKTPLSPEDHPSRRRSEVKLVTGVQYHCDVDNRWHMFGLILMIVFSIPAVVFIQLSSDPDAVRKKDVLLLIGLICAGIALSGLLLGLSVLFAKVRHSVILHRLPDDTERVFVQSREEAGTLMEDYVAKGVPIVKPEQPWFFFVFWWRE